MCARLPPAVWRPMVDAYATPRFVCVDGMAGEAGDLVQGLAPGCLPARHWLALHCLRAAAAAAAPLASLREYVEDVVVTAMRAEAGDVVAAAWGEAVAFSGATGLVLNAAKSVRFANTPAGRFAKARRSGPSLRSAFHDLGTDQ